MSKEDNGWFFAILTVGIFLGGTLGLWYAELRPSQTLVYDYQALIAGALALAAGLMTVFQMARIDIRQTQRHAELIAVGWRADALALDRYHTRVEALRSLATPIVASLNSIRRNKGSSGFERSDIPELTELTRSILDLLDFPLDTDDNKDMRKLLDASGEVHLLDIKRRALECRGVISKISYTDQEGGVSINSNPLDHSRNFDDLARLVQEMAEAIEQFQKYTGLLRDGFMQNARLTFRRENPIRFEVR